jgi:hypothetical protein
MKLVLPILAMLCTVFATLVAIVFCMGMGANAKPPEIRALQYWMGGLPLLGIGGVTVGILLIRSGQPVLAAAGAFAPTLIMSILFLVALLK